MGFNRHLFDNEFIDLTEELYEKLIEYNVSFHKASSYTLPIDGMFNQINPMKLNTIWKGEGSKLPWKGIIAEIKLKVINEPLTPYVLFLRSHLVYNPQTLEPYGTFIMAAHEGINSDFYTIDGDTYKKGDKG